MAWVVLRWVLGMEACGRVLFLPRHYASALFCRSAVQIATRQAGPTAQLEKCLLHTLEDLVLVPTLK